MSVSASSPAGRCSVFFVIKRLVPHLPSGVWIGGSIVFLLALTAIFAPYVAPYDPTTSDWMAIRQPPSAAHLFGTDDLGRDVFSRVIWGARASLAAGLVSVSIAVIVGAPLGLIAGYVGGWVDTVISRITDALLACPFLVLAIAFAAFLGPSLRNAMIAIGISVTPIFIRLVRGQTLVIRNEEFVQALRVVGASEWRIVVRHVLPNIAPTLIVQCTLSMAMAVLAEASLAFLGLGQVPPAPSWGAMLDAARQFLTNAPWMAVFPGLAIVATVISFNLLGDGLTDALEPRR